MFGDSLESTDGKWLGSDEFIKLVLSDGKVLGPFFNVDGIRFGIDVGTELGSFDRSCDG